MKCDWCDKDTKVNLAENRLKIVWQKPSPEKDAPPVTFCAQFHVGTPDIRQGCVCAECARKATDEMLGTVPPLPGS